MTDETPGAVNAAGGAPPSRLAVALAFAAVYVIWGSTYLAILICLETMPPFLMAGLRFLVAGALLHAWRRWRGDPPPTRRQWAGALLVGGLLFAGGNGGVVWSEQRVPSGIAALLVASVPAWMVMMLWLGGKRPGAQVLAGLVVGLLGVAVLVRPGGDALTAVDGLGATALLVGSGCWAAGSLISRRVDLPASALMSTSLQMLCGGALMTVAGLAGGEAARFHPSAFTLRSIIALAYLVSFGSLLAFSCYAWLLRVSTPARVSTYAYVNPVVAVLLGWLFAGEILSARVVVAGALVLVAVVLMTTGGRSPRAPAVSSDGTAAT